MSGKDGRDGHDGKTLWNGVKDPESTWGAPGDMFINATSKVLFGPKNLDGSWPVGVSMVGPAGATGLTGLTGLTGAQGPSGSNGGSGAAGTAGTKGDTGLPGNNGAAGLNGTNANLKLTESPTCDGLDDGNVANEVCQVGMTGPGGGIIFFVDFNGIYADFDYLEMAPAGQCDATGVLKPWGGTNIEVTAALGAKGLAIGSGKANTAAIKATFPGLSIAAFYADTCVGGLKNDWFVGSVGEMHLMFSALRDITSFQLSPARYWTSSAYTASSVYYVIFDTHLSSGNTIQVNYYVRPIRQF
jgi:hypothetical protein